jgi:hypothetical protein
VFSYHIDKNRKGGMIMKYPELNAQQLQRRRRSFIRFFHALPNDPPVNVDVYVNGKLIVKNLKYQDFTEYLVAKPGSYIMQLFPTGNHDEQLLEMHFNLGEGSIYTQAIIGTVDDISIELFEDMPVAAPDDEYAYMRFINLSPSDDGLNISIDNTPVVYDLRFTEVTDYLQLTSGKHTMKINLTSNGRQVVSHPNLVLKPKYSYTCYAVGFTDGEPFIQVVIPVEGPSYIDTSQ